MLRFAATEAAGDYQTIGAKTGIPTGTSTGKVPAILDYCRGMGLIQIEGGKRSAEKRPELTHFGRVVLLEDPFLKLDATQWVAHLNLCSPVSGADVWYQTFFQGTHALGMVFERAELESFLGVVYGLGKGGLVGPLVGMYEDYASFEACGAITETTDGILERRRAPVSEDLGWAYGAWILSLLEVHFPGARQVSITELDRCGGWLRITGWDSREAGRVLDLIARRGLLDVDRHMNPWLVGPLTASQAVWKHIYDDQS